MPSTAGDGKYILKDKVPVLCEDLMEWARWFESSVSERIVGNTVLPDGTCISTVFLGLDHRFGLVMQPLLFETMIFGGEQDQDQGRCCTWDEAVVMHEEYVAKAVEATDA